MNPTFKPDTSHPDILLHRLGQTRMRSLPGVAANARAHPIARAYKVVTEAAQALRTTAFALKRRLFPSADDERDAYFSLAVDRIDLERRIRNRERRPTLFWDGT